MSSDLASFYNGKTVVVTGHTGFKGTWLSAWLKAMGANVVGYALAPETGRPNLFDSAKVVEGMASVIADLRDPAAVAQTIQAAEPDLVFHLAAQALVRRSYEEPLVTYQTNIMGTAHVLEALRTSPNTKAAVIVTSDKCYENREWPFGYRETDPMGGYDPYSSSKGCAELVPSAYRRSYFSENGAAAIGSARAGNVIGGGDWAEDRLIPDIVRAVASGQPVHVRNPATTRPWQHVLEPVRGYLMLGKRLYEDGDRFAEGWNFGPAESDSVPVKEVTSRIKAYWNEAGLAVTEGQGEGPHEAHLLRLECGKARRELGWSPAFTLDDALRTTVDWYREYLAAPSSAPAMLERQIAEYAARF